MKPFTIIVFAAVLAGCHVGPKVVEFAPAQKPAGVEASLELDNASVTIGELLAVEDDALVVLIGGKVTRVPYIYVQKASFRGTKISFGGGKPPAANLREKLRLVSRFPQGLAFPLLDSLLAAYGQSEVAVLPGK